MQNNTALKKKNIGIILLLLIFLFSFVGAVVGGSMAVKAEAASYSVTSTGIWKNKENSLISEADSVGILITTARKEDGGTEFEYNAVLPFVYERYTTEWNNGIKYNMLGNPQTFSMTFEIRNIGCEEIVFEFTDANDSNKTVTLTLSFETAGKIKATVKSFQKRIIDGKEKEIFIGEGETTLTEEWVENPLTISYAKDTFGGLFKINTQALFRDTTKPEMLSFYNDTAKMKVKYAGGTDFQFENTSVAFKTINGQSLEKDADSGKIEPTTLPVINTANKADLTKTDLNLTGANFEELKSGLNKINLPIQITETLNATVYCFLAVHGPDGGEPEITSYTLGTSALSASFTKKGDYEVRIYASNESASLEAVKKAEKTPNELTDEDKAKFGDVVVTVMHYQVAKDTLAPTLAPGKIAELTDLVYDTFTTEIQELPAYDKPFTFPKPQDIYTDATDLNSDLIYYIAYKHKDDLTYTLSDSKTDPLSFNINKIGIFTFKYVVKDLSGNKIDYLENEHPEFRLIFTDTTRPEITMSYYQENQKATKDDLFSVPSPTVRDNSSDGASLIEDTTKIFLASKSWKKEDGVANLQEITDDFVDGGYKMTEVKDYYFVVFYQAKDTHNNATPAFEEEGFKDFLFLIEVVVSAPDSTTNTLLIVLIIIGSLAVVGIIALLFVKPIDETKWQNRRRKAK